jgi:hypothetical protein
MSLFVGLRSIVTNYCIIETMKQMKTFEQIKDEVAKEIGYSDYEGMASVTFGVANKVIRSLIDEVSKMYAQEVAEDVRKRCAENADETLEMCSSENNPSTPVNNSILTTEIILP